MRKTISQSIFGHWNCFSLPVATHGKDGHGLKLEKSLANFSSFTVTPAKISKIILLWLVLPWWYLFPNSRGVFCVWVKDNEVMPSAQNGPTTAMSCWHTTYPSHKKFSLSLLASTTSRNLSIYRNNKFLIFNKHFFCCWRCWTICTLSNNLWKENRSYLNK